MVVVGQVWTGCFPTLVFSCLPQAHGLQIIPLEPGKLGSMSGHGAATEEEGEGQGRPQAKAGKSKQGSLGQRKVRPSLQTGPWGCFPWGSTPEVQALVLGS